MILLQEASPLQIFGILITDWIQAIGATCAIIASFWAFISLFRRDKDLQSQINSLAQIAKELKSQTDELIKQTIESNRQTHQMLVSNTFLGEQVNMQKKGEKREEKYLQLEYLKNRLSIMPNFTLQTAQGGVEEIAHTLINNGETAIINKFESSDNIIILSSSKFIGQRYLQNYPIKLNIGFKEKYSDYLDYNYKVFFEDKEKNQYVQTIFGPGFSPKSISDPELIKDLKDNNL